MSDTFPLAVLVALAISVALSLVWVAYDAKQRGRSWQRIVFLCFLTWPIGFWIWHGIRPPPIIR